MERLTERARKEDPEKKDQKGEKRCQQSEGDWNHQRMSMTQQVKEILCGKHRGESEEENGSKAESGAGTHSGSEE